MFAGYHSGRSAAGFLNFISIRPLHDFKNCMGKTESVVMILLYEDLFLKITKFDIPCCFVLVTKTF
jgi:hypothetical protein